jgi:hypothetical protein
MLFGIGIVKTTEDFGNQGELPVNKDLLDYLAVDFRENQWNVKALLRKIVLSATYRQSSKASKELLALDPANRLMARGPANRLTAEMIRDNALVASGLFKNEIGGKSIKPYQPEGLWVSMAIFICPTRQTIFTNEACICLSNVLCHILL